MNYAKAIKECRIRAGLSQIELSKKAKLTQGYLSIIECGRQRPGPNALKKICKVLKIHPAILLFMAMDIDDIDKGKKSIYKKLRKPINALINDYLNETYDS